ncbi:3-hydroxyacyl-CoA dehydrogenase NAD-binding domain-containing protein [Devosia sp. ZB163]|uniref:3-hydroxyacyl-CoA dehydrogenase NAD-binding domain-containing protein n=1 Tax=Devosia sp. ZB163 TaxID=3025938 RepID=UPI002362BFCF|nr:3-hydroxyacyl-CoA dehydrogenase NAD-binding domain-containing protein [Devosia sp. ZB163]MDC9825166.1 3-hydroxyacyl-CoA dehydrogenase NAD-binding domain-containing protein [Devosia sp. ZB163]
MPSPSHVRCFRDDDIAIVEVDNPPVNALSHAVRRALFDTLQDLEADANVAGVVIACRGKTFFAGADIAEFDKPPEAPVLGDLIALLDQMTTPTAAAMKGTVLGGGLEFALACRMRILDRDAVVGLPEIKLGLIPGAGGTVRLPRLVGPDVALGMIATGETLDASQALAHGLVHATVDTDLTAATIAHLRAHLHSPPARVRDMVVPAYPAGLDAFEDRAGGLAEKSPGDGAQAAAIKAVRNSLALGFDAALAEERLLFEALRASPASRAQRHLFFAERRTLVLPDLDLRSITPRPVQCVGVVGAGTLGSGIAAALAAAGYTVRIRETSEAALEAGRERVWRIFDSMARKGGLDAAAARDRVIGTLTLSDFADCDLVIEAAFEDLDVKRAIFAELDRVTRPGAILATNTSYLDVNVIAEATVRVADVAGMHFFSPAHVMKLVEVVRTGRTAPDVLATLARVAKVMGKVPVVVGVCHGFVGNRMLGARNAQIPRLLMEGALPQDIDGALRDFGWPMGPLQMWDMAGLDIAWRNRRFLGEAEPIGDGLCALGRFGQKTGRGYYSYVDGRRDPLPDPEVADLIKRLSSEAGITRRRVSSEEIIERTHLPMINEACRILEERIAVRSADIDVIWANGYGFPRALGGPMHWAERLGWRRIVDGLSTWHRETGDDVFRPSDRLLAMSAA